MERSIVVLSGGQDSMTCLGEALDKTEIAAAVTFKYGQKHEAEVAAAAKVCDKYKLKHIIIDLSPILGQMQSSALVNHGDVSADHSLLPGLPASFVPARNALFLTAAYGIAMELECDVIYTGVCQTDYSGYPDCRAEFIRELQNALWTGYQKRIRIATPLMWMTKAETWEMSYRNNMMDDIIEFSVTCYNGDTDLKHAWGHGCGHCPACQLRAKGYDEWVKFGNDLRHRIL